MRDAAWKAVMTAESRTWLHYCVICFGFLIVVLVLSWVVFVPLVTPTWHYYAWLAYMVATLAEGLVSVTMVMVKRSRGDVDAPLRFGWTGQLGQSALIVGIALSPWALLPHAGDEIRSMVLITYGCFVSMMAVASGARVPVTKAEFVLLTGSPAAFLWWHAVEGALPMALLLTFVTGTAFMVGSWRQRSVDDAINARRASDRTDEALRAALATVAAERDAKTRFIASASHDLQQPLQAAQLFFESAVDSRDVALRTRAIAGARQAFQSTQALIGTMLEHLKLEAGVVEPITATVALAPLIGEVATENEPAARAAGMRLIALPSRLLVCADAELLRRALRNLITNAVRHAQGERVLIAARRRGETVRIWVIDDGNGVAAADRARLFDDYAQGSGDYAQRGGFGLGLASTRRALVLMDGNAGFESRWLGGAAFWLDLPLAEPAIADRSEPLCAAA